MNYTPSLNRLIKELTRLPGIGIRTAGRLAFHILGYTKNEAFALSHAIEAVKNNVRLCSQCFNISEGDLCEICLNPKRDDRIICVVETPIEVFSIESTNEYRGLYHVLHGRLAPIAGIGPEDLKINELIKRVKNSKMDEIILATNPDVEGEATATYIKELLKSFDCKVTKLAMGLPSGAHLEYADARTLCVSMNNRETLQ